MLIPVGNRTFQALPSESLLEIAHYLSYSPVTKEEFPRLVRNLPREEQLRWFDCHRQELEEEFCRIGGWTFGEPRTYERIVCELARKMGVNHPQNIQVEQVELEILAKVWNDAVAKLTPEQARELRMKAEELSQKYGKSLGPELAGAGALSAAHMSGFGIYLLGSTVLGAIDGALGFGLGFGAFTGLSSIISTMIGPVGWGFLGLFAIVRLGAPNYKKILPAVVVIAMNRPQVERPSVWKSSHTIAVVVVGLILVLGIFHWLL